MKTYNFSVVPNQEITVDFAYRGAVSAVCYKKNQNGSLTAIGETTVTNTKISVKFSKDLTSGNTFPANYIVIATRDAQITDNVVAGYVMKDNSANQTVSVTTTTTTPSRTSSFTVGADALQRRIMANVAQFADWCETYGVKGVLGEFNAPARRPDSPKWLELLELVYQELDYRQLSSIQWASGRWWNPTYELADYIKSSTGTNLDTATDSALVLEKHLSVPSRVIRGISLAGLEFGDTGQATFWPTAGDLDYLKSRGIKFIRLPIKWEQFQPTLGGALDTTQLTNLETLCTQVNARGMKLILDLHNYARRFISGSYVYMSTGGTVTIAHFVDFWTKMSAWTLANKNRDTAIHAFELMNEPHDIASEFTAGTTLYSFANTSELTPFTGSPTRSTSIFSDGAGVWSVAATGYPQFLDGTGTSERNLSAYSTLRVTARAESAFTGTFPIRAIVQFGSNNPLGAAFSQATGNSVGLSASTTVTADYVASNGTLGNLRSFGFGFEPGNPDGGRVSAQNVHIDSIVAGNVLFGRQIWESASQQAVTAIRAAGDKRELWVAGYNYSGLHNFRDQHRKPWIDDPNVRFVGHGYFDSDFSGNYDATTETYVLSVTAAANAGF